MGIFMYILQLCFSFVDESFNYISAATLDLFLYEPNEVPLIFLDEAFLSIFLKYQNTITLTSPKNPH